MSRTRHASPDNLASPDNASPDSQVSQGHRVTRSSYAPPGPDAPGPPPGGRRVGMARLLAGAGLCAVLLVLGELAKAGPVARLDLRADEHIAADRNGTLTTLAKLASDIATPETVGVGLMILVPVILVLMRRRLDAARVFCMFAGALAAAEIAKRVIGEHRPPASLQAVAADHTPSFPSGHATTAAVLAVALVLIAATVAWRVAAVLLGSLYAVAVAASRVYLGDHYPLDVLGGMICAIAAGLVVSGLFALPALQPLLRRLRLTMPLGPDGRRP